jgi:patatin-like phospholipase
LISLRLCRKWWGGHFFAAIGGGRSNFVHEFSGSIFLVVIVDNSPVWQRQVGEEMMGGDDAPDRKIRHGGIDVRHEMKPPRPDPRAFHRDIGQVVGDELADFEPAVDAWVTIVQGQPGFFSPRQPSPWLSLAGAQSATSYYDNAPLRETLEELVDFSLINERAVRFAVGAVNVLNGNFIYFDNVHEDIGPEHVMASGALPPALPMVKIGTDHFWDGGIVSNTPLQHLLDQEDNLNSLVFQVDLFSARGVLPRDIQDVMARHKDIMYSSRTRYNTDVYRRITLGKPGWPKRSTRCRRNC